MRPLRIDSVHLRKKLINRRNNIVDCQTFDIYIYVCRHHAMAISSSNNNNNNMFISYSWYTIHIKGCNRATRCKKIINEREKKNVFHSFDLSNIPVNRHFPAYCIVLYCIAVSISMLYSMQYMHGIDISLYEFKLYLEVQNE